MKLHDLKPAPGSRTTKRRVGRGIAAGQGKTAGRGTKGQKARAGGKIPAWFEGGQTPLHQRIPKLRGFRNAFKVTYEVVNVGDIARVIEEGKLESGEMPGSAGSTAGKASKKGSAPITVNQEILRGAGLVRRLDRPMKVLGGGDLSTAVFVVADAVSASARSKIESAGGTVSILEVPTKPRKAVGVTTSSAEEAETEVADASAAPAAVAEAPSEAATEVEAPKPKTRRGKAASTAEDGTTDASAEEPTADASAEAVESADDAAVAQEDPPGSGDESSAPAKPRAARKPRTTKSADADA